MRNFLLLLGISLITSFTYAQNATILSVNDTRSIDDAPDFLKKSLRVDFKSRKVIDVPGTGTYSANITIAPWGDRSGNKNHQMNFNDGGIFYRNATYIDNVWGSWSKFLLEDANGNVGIGTTTPKAKLDVAGTIRATEVKIEITAGADYVFAKEYDLKPLSEVESFIKNNKHLPEIPSEKQMQEEGLSINEFQIKLLQKIEELTLYSIDQEKKTKALENELRELRSQLNK